MKILFRILFILILLLIGNHLVHAQWQGVGITQVIDVGYRPSSINVAKANNDEWYDLVLTPTSADTFIDVITGNSAGRFGAPVSTDRDVNYTQTDVGDFDRDGIDDLAISSYWSNGFIVYKGQREGKYLAGQHYQLTGHGKRVSVTDLNNDGALDVAALSGGSGQPITLHIYYGDNKGNFRLDGIYPSVLHTDNSMKFIDKNEDGLQDIMVSTSFPWFMIYYQSSEGTFTPQYWPVTDDIQLPYPRYDVADLNSDRQPDVIAYYTPFDGGPGGFQFFPGKGDTTFSVGHTPLSYQGLNITTIKVADLNHDGHQDLVFNHMRDLLTYTDSLFYRLGNGDFTFGEPVLIRFPAPVSQWIVADANNDQFPDIIAYSEGHKISIAMNGNIVAGDEEPVAPAIVHAFPNPFMNELRIAASTYPAKYHVRDLTGVTMQVGVMDTATQLDASAWASGLYLVTIKSATDNAFMKVVRQ